jgi:hypothetical protein
VYIYATNVQHPSSNKNEIKREKGTYLNPSGPEILVSGIQPLLLLFFFFFFDPGNDLGHILGFSFCFIFLIQEPQESSDHTAGFHGPSARTVVDLLHQKSPLRNSLLVSQAMPLLIAEDREDNSLIRASTILAALSE